MAPRWGQGADWDNAERVIPRTGWERRQLDRCRRCGGVPNTDFRSGSRSRSPATCSPAGGSGPPQPPTSIHSASGRQAAFQPRPGQYLDADLWITAPRACQIRRRQEFPALRGPLDPCRASARRGMPPGRTRGLSLFLLSAGGGVSFLEVSAFVCEPARTSGRNLHGSSSRARLC